MSDERREFRVTDKRGRVEEPGGEAVLEGEVLAQEAARAGAGDDRVEGLQAELDEARRQADERYDQLLRLKAEFENTKQRLIREQTEIVERASLRVVERLLPVLDDLDRAIDAARAHEGAEPIVRGIELVASALWNVLDAEGLERVEADGHAFDPQHHEATLSSPGPVDEPTVLEVVRPGYRLKGRTIRPALVHVQTPDEPDAEPES